MEAWPSTSARIPLPHLQHLWCPVRLVPSIFTHGLKRVCLSWVDIDTTPNEVEKTFVALKSMARTDIPFLCCNDDCDGYLPEVVDSFSRNIPHTRTLQLRLCDYLDDLLELIGRLRDCLSHFTGLMFLSLEYIFAAYHGFNRDEEDDQQLAQAVGDACPTLEGCCLYKYA
ncbi:hypothetical protein FB451DRAFT_1221131 [Mycena latifolia]|nr:hypothetical protein FB451DRAFT_1221131 [Mycena latifolia]